MDTNAKDSEYRIYLEQDAETPLLTVHGEDELFKQLTQVFFDHPEQTVYVREVTESLSLIARPLENGRRRDIINLDKGNPRFQVWLGQKE